MDDTNVNVNCRVIIKKQIISILNKLFSIEKNVKKSFVKLIKIFSVDKFSESITDSNGIIIPMLIESNNVEKIMRKDNNTKLIFPTSLIVKEKKV